MLYVNKLFLNIPDTAKPRVVVIGGGFGHCSTRWPLPVWNRTLLPNR
jgi:hypothetical protein